ncbi:hypothetical protein FVEN_g12967 [Fusarium venenatum]|nr:hypothetical protein FVEN_g12967 [Fusarium venenatum]
MVMKNKHERPADLSSWVPAFHVQMVSSRIYDKRYIASGGCQAVIYDSPVGILKVNVLIIDTIAEVEEYLPEEGP